MKLTKSQIKRIIREEMSRVSDSQIEIDVSSLIREQAEDLDEGLFTQALKTAAINMVPGGRIAADFTRARGFDTFCPLGPYIQTDFIESPELQIKSYVNGELKQNGNTRDMMFKIGEILEFVSSIMTLLPGDVILTGTPEGVSRVDRGDEIKIDIETLGTQTNTVE